MDVELIMGRNLIGDAQMEQVLRASALRKLTGIFDECVHRARDLSVQQKSGLSGKVTRVNLGRPIERKLPGRGPIGRELSRPWQLQPWIVPMARYCRCASRDAQEGDDRYIESGRRAKLLFDSD